MKDAQTNPGFIHLFELGSGALSWLHMCIRHEETSRFLMDEVALDDLIVDAMIEEDTRSRIRVRPDGIMVLLKAMHVQGEDMAMPEDMISLRIWIDEHRIITTREADIDPIREMVRRIGAGRGPENAGAFLADLIELHLDEVDPYIERLEDSVNHLDRKVAVHDLEESCPRLSDTQLQISAFLRHLEPQRHVLQVLSALDHPVLADRDRTRFDNALNQLLRILETLQSLRERSDILNDQMTRIQDRQLARTSYIFAVAATVFLPLGFVTGLFGVNLLGIPMSGHPQGFAILLGVCALVSVVLLAFFRWRRWF